MEKLTSYQIKSIKIDFCTLTSDKKLLVDISFISLSDLKPLFSTKISKVIQSICNIDEYFADCRKYNSYKESIENQYLITNDVLDLYYKKIQDYELNNLDGLSIDEYWMSKHFGSEYLNTYILHANQMASNNIINPKHIQIDSSSNVHEFIKVYQNSLFIINNLKLTIDNIKNTLYLNNNDDYGFVKYFSNNEDLNKELIRIRGLQPLFTDIDLTTWEQN